MSSLSLPTRQYVFRSSETISQHLGLKTDSEGAQREEGLVNWIF